MQNRTGLVLCALTLLIGFLMICLGAFFVSSDSILHCQKHLVLAYLLLPLGFGMLLSGIFWSAYWQASKSKGVFSHVLRQHLAHRDLPLATVDRPDFYPPAYEESLDTEKQAHAAEGEFLDVPMGLKLKDGNEAHPKAPPSYQQSVADSAAAATSEAARPSPELKAGRDLWHAGCTSWDSAAPKNGKLEPPSCAGWPRSSTDLLTHGRAAWGPWQGAASTKQTFQRIPTNSEPEEPWDRKSGVQDGSVLGEAFCPAQLPLHQLSPQ
ncbi:transmembrane protein 252 [Erethizon dorsatum]